jgi:hypothetical protein
MEFNRVKSALKKSLVKLSPKKQRIFDTVAPFISGVKQTQLVMLILGEVGSGKAHLVRIIGDYAYLLHGKPTGKFATIVLNRHSRAMCILLKTTISGSMMDSLKEYLKDTVLIILEDCNLLSFEAVMQISSRLSVVTGKSGIAFGGFHTILVGDIGEIVVQLSDGTSMMQTAAPVTTDAIAGHNLLSESLTHFIDLSCSKRPIIIGGMEHHNDYPEFVKVCTYNGKL